MDLVHNSVPKLEINFTSNEVWKQWKNEKYFIGVSGFLLNTAPETIISKDITQVLHRWTTSSKNPELQ